MAAPILQSPDIAHLIQLAVAPVFLLSGVGVTLNVLTIRLARIIDRARTIEAEMAAAAEPPQVLHARLKVLARRSKFINGAIALATVSAMLVTLTVMQLFANDLLPFNLSTAIAITFVSSMMLLTLALLLFFIEVRIATAALRFGGKT
ncbi:MAG TPA: DUF2721 domain-containing protein [Steroidobacteraceae bacterium]